MKILIHIIMIVAVTFWGITASAMRTDQLMIACQDDVAKLICLGYISGATDTLVVLNQLSGDKLGFNLCIPSEGISNDQAMKIVLKYIKNNPDKLKTPARSTIIIALSKAYQCKK